MPSRLDAVKRMLRLLGAALYVGLVCTAIVADMRSRVVRTSDPWLIRAGAPVPERYTGIVLGCRVNGDDPSACLEERLQKALELHASGDVQRLLLSGDHGTTGYDEVNTMRDWLLARGVPEDDVFLDHAGFDTWDSMVRARDVFQVDGAIIITQAFHLPRAIYLARAAGLDAVGIAADPPTGSSCAGSAIREPFACTKAVLNVLFDASPHLGGPAIPISGSPAATLDHH